MQIIAAAAVKGGTGKTSTIAALAQAAAKSGKEVLVIDLEPQANCTWALGADQNQPGTYQLLNGDAVWPLIQHTEQNISVIAASPDIATLKTTPGSAKRLARAIEKIKGQYDYIFIDTPPTVGELLFNALQAATGLIIPLEVDAYSLQGLYQITDIARQMQNSNPELSIIGVLLSRFDARPKINRYLRDVIAQKCEEMGIPFVLPIRPGVSIKEAAALQQSLYDYDADSKPAADYMQLFQTIENKNNTTED